MPVIDTAHPPRVVHTACELRAAVTQARRAGDRIGCAPTMGALHEGHLSLVDAARRECEFVVVTIFVNPTQFAPHEDFAKYPRTLEADVAALAERGVDLVFAPAAEEMYPPGFSTYVDPPAVAEPLEGRHRPDHFRGVATVVLKLLNLVQPDSAYFGQKDYQQARVIQQMAADLNLPVGIAVCPIVREADGLAMSSRNRYLSEAERRRALGLSQALKSAAELHAAGEHNAETLRQAMADALRRAGVEQVDYAALVHPETLADVERADADTMALIACRVGDTRLIDNCRLGEGV